MSPQHANALLRVHWSKIKIERLKKRFFIGRWKQLYLE